MLQPLALCHVQNNNNNNTMLTIIIQCYNVNKTMLQPLGLCHVQNNNNNTMINDMKFRHSPCV